MSNGQLRAAVQFHRGQSDLRHRPELEPAGPDFQFREVNLVSDMKFTGPGIPDYISANDRIRVTVVVDEFIEQQCLVRLEPVATEYR